MPSLSLMVHLFTPPVMSRRISAHRRAAAGTCAAKLVSNVHRSRRFERCSLAGDLVPIQLKLPDRSSRHEAQEPIRQSKPLYPPAFK